MKYFLIVFIALFFSCSNNKTENLNVLEENQIVEDISLTPEEIDESDALTLVEEENTINNDVVAPKPPANNWGIKLVNSPEGLNLREEPNLNSGKIVLIPNQSPVYLLKKDSADVTIDDITNRWFYVQYGEYLGWVFGGYLIDSEKDSISEALSYRMIFVEEANEPGKYIFDSVMIEENKDQNDIEIFMPDDKSYFKLTQIEGNDYLLQSNFWTISEDTKNVIIGERMFDPFYYSLAEKGGSSTERIISLHNNNLLVILRSEYTDMSKIEGPI